MPAAPPSFTWCTLNDYAKMWRVAFCLQEVGCQRCMAPNSRRLDIRTNAEIHWLGCSARRSGCLRSTIYELSATSAEAHLHVHLDQVYPPKSVTVVGLVAYTLPISTANAGTII